MAISASALQSGFTDIGGAVQDLFQAQADQQTAQADMFSAQGDFAAASGYTQAAALAAQDITFEQQSVAIQEVQAQRQLAMSLGETSADVAGAGFSGGKSVSAQEILRSSASQGALQQSLISQQGYITEQGFREQQQAYQTQAAQETQAGFAAEASAQGAREAAKGADFGGLIKGIAGIGMLGLALIP